MGQDEDAEPLVRRTGFCRREQASRRLVAHAPKLSQHELEAESDVTGDVFEKDPLGQALANDTGDLGPEVPGIIGPAAFASRAEGLARISGEDDVERPAEGPGIETAQVVPDWRGCEVSCALGGDENAAGIAFPLDESTGVEAWFGKHDAQIQASAACAEGQSVPGT